MKYKEMKKSCVKVSYNIMGEPVKKQIHLGKKRPRPKHQSSIFRADSVDLSQSSPTRDQSRVRKKCAPPRPNYQNLIPSDLVRIIHVLREILFGKVIRDVMETSHSSSHSATLPDVLRFFCQTSFGVTTVAEKRQTDLFHAILANQGSSSFLRIMKRLLDIPGIKPFHEKNAAIYYEVWCWLIQNDAIADVGTTGRFSVSHKDMLQCIRDLCSSNGNHLSPRLLHSIENCMKSREEEIQSSNQSRVRTKSGYDNQMLDADDTLEKVMHVIENLDKDVSRLDKELFSEPDTKILVGNHVKMQQVNIKDNKVQGSRRLDPVKSLLHDCAALDKNRYGVLKCNQFASVINHWYEEQYGILAVSSEVIGDLINCFTSNEDIERVDYVSIAGVFYTFLLEDGDTIPTLEVMVSYINYKSRGVDQHHIDCIQNYVENARFKTAKIKSITYRDRVVNSRRTISRIRPHADSDFISRWAIAPSAKVEKKPVDNYQVKQLPTRSTTLHNKSAICKSKTPLHVFNVIDAPNPADELNSLTEDGNKEASMRSGATDVTVEQNSDAEEPAIFTSVYVRFPDVEPFRAPLGKSSITEPAPQIVPVETQEDHSSGICEDSEHGFEEKERKGEAEISHRSEHGYLEERVEETDFSKRPVPCIKEHLEKDRNKETTFLEDTKPRQQNFIDKDTNVPVKSPRKKLNSPKSPSVDKSPRISMRISVPKSKKAAMRERKITFKESTEIDKHSETFESISKGKTSPLKSVGKPHEEIIRDKIGLNAQALTNTLDVDLKSEIHKPQTPMEEKKIDADDNDPNLQGCAEMDTTQNSQVIPRIALVQSIDECNDLHDTVNSGLIDLQDTVNSELNDFNLTPEKRNEVSCQSIVPISNMFGPQRPPKVSMTRNETILDEFTIQPLEQIPRFAISFSLPPMTRNGTLNGTTNIQLFHQLQKMFRRTTKVIIPQSVNRAFFPIPLSDGSDLTLKYELTLGQVKYSKLLAYGGSKEVNNEHTDFPVLDQGRVVNLHKGGFQSSASKIPEKVVPITPSPISLVKVSGGMTVQDVMIPGKLEVFGGSKTNAFLPIFTVSVGNIHLVNNFDWDALFQTAECTIDEMLTKILSNNGNVKEFFGQKEWRSSKIVRKSSIKNSPDFTNSVGVKSLLLTSRGRKHKKQIYSTRKVMPKNRIIQPIAYRIRS